MIIIPLQAIPNQKLNIALDGNSFDITIKEAAGCMTSGISLNQTVLTSGQRIAPFQPLLPRCLENGNFMVFTKSYQLPAYINFGITQFLWYFSQTEIDLYRTAPAPLFNLDADLPLRYKPQGYVSA